MGFTVKADEGLHFSFGPWPNCAIFFNDDSGVGSSAIVGVGPVGAIEYISIGTLWMGDLGSAVASFGSLGAFLMSLVGPANTTMQNLLDSHPAWAPITNADPVSVENANKALAEYFKVTPSADGTYPIMSFKPYP